MFVQYALSAALTVSCLIMVVLNQPIEACSCLDITDIIPSCQAVEFETIFVTGKDSVAGRGDTLGYVVHTVRIVYVIQSHMNLTAGMEVTLKTHRSYRHTPDLTKGQGYFLLAEADVDESGFTEICWMIEHSQKLCRRIRLLSIMKKVEA